MNGSSDHELNKRVFTQSSQTREKSCTISYFNTPLSSVDLLNQPKCGTLLNRVDCAQEKKQIFYCTTIILNPNQQSMSIDTLCHGNGVNWEHLHITYSDFPQGYEAESAMPRRYCASATNPLRSPPKEESAASSPAHTSQSSKFRLNQVHCEIIRHSLTNSLYLHLKPSERRRISTSLRPTTENRQKWLPFR